MNIRERIIATLNGQPCDCLPFMPRMDIWYKANKFNGTLPDRFKNATLREITDELGFGYHAINPDFQDYRIADGDINTGIGIYDLNLTPYIVKLHNVGINVRREASGKTYVEYDTPKGKITTCNVYDDRMRAGGATLHVITEHALKSCDDYPAMAHILRNAEVIPNYEKLQTFKDEFMGDRGLTVGLAGVYCSPVHYMLKELMSMETFYYEMMDNPDEMEEFSEQIAPFCHKLFDIAAASPADALLSGSNFDSYVTAPMMYRDYIMPELQRQSKQLHDMGKYLICHTDGENTGLLPLFVESGFDIADSICPAPMTKIPLKDIRDAFAGKISIWGGIPSISTLPDSMSQYDFEKLIDNMLCSIGRGDHMIVSIADTLPPAADLNRVMHIAKKVAGFGPIK